MKKILSSILMILLIAGLGASAFAGTVTINGATGGTTQIWSGSLSGDDAGEVQLYAQAADGYKFDHWEYSGGTGASASNPEVFTTFDRWVQPVFVVEPDQNVLNEDAVFQSSESIVTPEISTEQMPDLSNPQTTLTTGEENLKSGELFLGEPASTEADSKNSEDMKSPAVGTIEVLFSPEGSGQYTEAEGGTINGNTVKMVTVSPKDSSRYEFSHWITENGSVYYDNPQYFDVTRSGEPVNRTITAVFKEKSTEPPIVPPEPATSYTVTAEASPAACGYVYGTPSGAQATFGIYSIDPEYSFVRWVINGIEYPYGQRIIKVTLNQNLYGVAQLVKNTATTYKVTYKPDNANEHYDLQPQYKSTNAPVILYDGGYTRKGYVQTGWISTDWVYYPLGGFYNENADVTLVPYWEKAGNHYVTVYYNGSGGNIKTGATLVKNGDSFLVPDDGSVTFKFNSAQGYFPSSAVLNGVSRSFSNNTFTVWGRGSDQVLNVTFASVYSPPQTGDSSNITLWTSLGILAFAGLGTLGLLRKRTAPKKSGNK